MKYSEFEREVEKLGFTHVKRSGEKVVKLNGKSVMGIRTNTEYIIDNEWAEYQSLNKTTQEQLFDLAYQLAKTPLAEREEEKLYNVVLPLVGSSTRYMQRGEYRDGVLIFDNSGCDFVKSNPKLYAFTEQEIKDIDGRYLAFKVEVVPE